MTRTLIVQRIEYTPEQERALSVAGLSIIHATQPGGPGATLFINDVDDDLATIDEIHPDGRRVTRQRAFWQPDGWDIVYDSTKED